MTNYDGMGRAELIARLVQTTAERDELSKSLQDVCRWLSAPSSCPDCDTFRAAPSSIDFLHHQDCDVLEQMNIARMLLGKSPIDETHNFDDPQAEMRRLANERRRVD